MTDIKVYHIKSDEELKKWNTFVNEQGGGFFQSLLYYKFCEEFEETDPYVICAFKDKKIIGSLLAVKYVNGKGLKRYLSRRVIIIGGPVLDIKQNVNETSYYLLETLNRYLNREVVYTEFRNLSDISYLEGIFNKLGYKYNPHLNVQVDLTDKLKLLKSISKSKKRQINKSIKNGAHIIEAENLIQVKEFYSILISLYNRKVKRPLPKWDFFESIFLLGKETNSIKYLLIEYNDKIVGGILCPIYNNIIYEWYIGNIETNNNIYPGVLATWAAIEYGIEHGLKQFDFMGAGKPDEDYGVREFKLKFGGNLVEHGRFLRKNAPILYWIGLTALKIIKKLK